MCEFIQQLNPDQFFPKRSFKQYNLIWAW